MSALTLSEKRAAASRARRTFSGGPGGPRPNAGGFREGAGRKPTCDCGVCAKCKRRANYAKAK